MKLIFIFSSTPDEMYIGTPKYRKATCHRFASYYNAECGMYLHLSHLLVSSMLYVPLSIIDSYSIPFLRMKSPGLYDMELYNDL